MPRHPSSSPSTIVSFVASLGGTAIGILTALFFVLALRDLHGGRRSALRPGRGRLRRGRPPDGPPVPGVQLRSAALLRRQRELRRGRRDHRRPGAVGARRPGARRVGDPRVRHQLHPQHRLRDRADPARAARARRRRLAADARRDRDLLASSTSRCRCSSSRSSSATPSTSA